ncbi:MAG: ATP-grasp domain-containing protein [Candidatus Lokiarchaeota archaeon]|nr:ATP-grasp domain-containing protein [Candidatus Lokiarchaeota archaeon]
MNEISKGQAAATTREGVSPDQKDDLIHVLLYDIDYMRAQEAKCPGDYVSTTVDYLEDSMRINEEIKQAVLEHPRLDPAKVRFFTNPYKLISDVVRRHDRIKCVLNFCDDFGDRSELWSIPILFEMFKLPFCCYGTKGIQSHNKFYAYAVAQQLGVPVPESRFVTRDSAAGGIGVNDFPVFVKPNDGGGSEGITFRSVARDEDELHRIVWEMLGSYDELLACEYLPGDELTVALMRREGEVVPLAVKQIQFINFSTDPTIYTCDIKWDESFLGERRLSVKLFDGDPAVKERVVEDSVKLFKVFQCKDFARLDWKCDAGGNPKFIDFNENPMYGVDSSFLWCLERAGYTRRDLFNAIIDNLFSAMDARD